MAKESKPLLQRRERVAAILPILKQTYPHAKCSLDYRTPLELLIATILSAQCTDERVNIVTRTLFEKYRSPEDYLAVPQEELEADIHSTGFYRNKAKNIRGACCLAISSTRPKGSRSIPTSPVSPACSASPNIPTLSRSSGTSWRSSPA